MVATASKLNFWEWHELQLLLHWSPAQKRCEDMPSWLMLFLLPAGALGLATQCRTVDEVVILVEHSTSTLTFNESTPELLRSLVASLDIQAPGRLGIATFDGCVGCTVAESARELVTLTSDTATILAAIDTLPTPSGKACTSCGLEVAGSMFSGSTTATKLLITVTDGPQTVGGTDSKAAATAAGIQASGVAVAAAGLYDAQLTTLELMGSAPNGTYAQLLPDYDALRGSIDTLADAWCASYTFSNSKVLYRAYMLPVSARFCAI